MLTAAVSYSPVTLAQASLSSADFGGGMATPHEATDEWVFSLGAGVGYLPDYEGGDDYEVTPISEVWMTSPGFSPLPSP